MGGRTIRAVTALAGVLVMGVGTASASPADTGTEPGAAGTCGDTFDVEIDGAKAHWEIHCSHPSRIDKVTGWVEDTRLDGQAASLRFTNGGAILLGHFLASGWGEKTSFDFEPTQSREEVEGRLQLSW